MDHLQSAGTGTHCAHPILAVERIRALRELRYKSADPPAHPQSKTALGSGSKNGWRIRGIILRRVTGVTRIQSSSLVRPKPQVSTRLRLS